jgi:hypothetical protein
MADKGTIEAIEKLKAARPRALLDSMMSLGLMLDQKLVAAGLRFLVEDFRAQAVLVMDSGARGKGAEATALRSTASTLSLLADAVDKVNLDAVEPTRTRSYPIEWCGSNEPHLQHRHQLQDGPAADAWRTCDGPRPTRDISGLDALVIDSTVGPDFTGGAFTETVTFGGFAEPGSIAPFGIGDGPAPQGEQAQIELTHVESFPLAGLPSRAEHDAMRAYLAGETNVMPGDEPASYRMPTGLLDAFPVHVTERGPVTDPEILEAAKVLEPAPAPFAFAEPAAVVAAGEPVMPGRRLTFAELRAPAPVATPEHTSNSQLTQMNDCGLQYRLQRLEPDVVERPQWHLVGGKALHRVAEEFERLVLEVKNPQFVRDRVKVAGGAEGLWQKAFGAEIVAQMLACPQVQQADWRAAGRGGAEGYTWWLTQGVDMIQRYLDLRMAELAAPDGGRVIMGAQGGSPMIEIEGTLNVEGTPHKIVIDQVWRWGPDALMVDDLKSGANAPRGGTFQLAQYGWWLRMELGYEGKIYGRYWNARTGQYSAPVDLLELHPWDEIVWRVKDAAAKKDAGLFGPNPGPFCGGCAVKHACPVVSRG